MKSHSQITLIPLFFITLFAMTLTACGASAQDIALHKAVRANDPQAVQQLLEEGADVNAPETAETTALDSKSTPLINAAGKEYLEVVEILIAHGADVNATSIYGTSALGEAAIKGNDEIVTLLLTSGADINTTNKWGKTPLMWAADFGQTSIVQLLLAAGADASLKDEDGLTALDFAQEGDHDEVVALLLADADTTTSDPDVSSTAPPTAVSQPTPAPFIEFTQLHQQQLPHGVINRAALSPEAGLTAAAFRDGGIGLYDLTTFAETDFVALEDQAASLTFSPDGSQLALGLNGEMRLWSIENGRFQPNPLAISDMGSWVEAVTFSSDGALLAAAIYPKTIRIWNRADNSMVQEIDNGQWSKSLGFSPDGQFLAAGDTDGIIQVWEVENGRLQQTLGEPNDELAVHDWGITALAFSPDGTQLAATNADNFDTIIWDSGIGTPQQTIQEDTNFVKGYHFSPDGNTLLTIRADAKLWHTQTGKWLQTLENPGTFLAAGAFIGSDKIVTLNVQGLLREWGEEDKETSVATPTHASTPVPLPTETAVSTSTSVSLTMPEPTQRRVFIEDKTRLILKEANGSQHQIGEALEIQDPMWLPDGRHLIFTEWDRREQMGQTTMGLVRILWLVDADTAQQTLLGKNYHSPQIAPNGRYLAVFVGTDWLDGCSFDRRLRFLQLDNHWCQLSAFDY